MTAITAQVYRLCVPTSPMRAVPAGDAECTNECLFGECLENASASSEHAADFELETDTVSHDGTSAQWQLVTARRDGYTGFVQKVHLQPINHDTKAATHWVSARSTLIFKTASIKSAVLHRLPFLSQIVALKEGSNGFHQLSTGGFVWSEHLLETGKTMKGTALDLAHAYFLGAPYLWGGNTEQGLDCSGLVQALASAKGIALPRDSVDQERAVKKSVALEERRSGDLVFWPGHTGILIDPDTLLHATAHTLSCVIEPLAAVNARAGEISSIKRLFD